MVWEVRELWAWMGRRGLARSAAATAAVVGRCGGVGDAGDVDGESWWWAFDLLCAYGERGGDVSWREERGVGLAVLAAVLLCCAAGPGAARVPNGLGGGEGVGVIDRFEAPE